MASVTDFLFEGQPPKSVTTYGQTTQNVPQWMSDYTQGLMARANAVAAEPYQPYTGPRIAPFSPDQQAAFGLGEQNIGSYQPYMEGAAAGTAGGLEQAAAAGQVNPLTAAQPYLSKASGSFTDPGNVSQYMNPYIQNVLDRQADLSNRNLTEKFIPQLQSAFEGAGQYGSRGGAGSMEDVGIKGTRDIAEDLQSQQLATLGQAYGQAADIYGTDQSRQASLAQTAGGLEQAAGNLQLGSAQQQISGAGQLGTLGGQAQQYGNMDAATLAAIGQQQQQQGQSSLDLAYQDYQNQLNYPKQQTQFMSDILRGVPSSAVPTSTTSTGTGPANVYQPSPLSQIVGGYAAYKGLTSARGGYINRRRYARGGFVRGGLEVAAAA